MSTMIARRRMVLERITRAYKFARRVWRLRREYRGEYVEVVTN